jgi:microcystin-dependent protein
MSKINLGTAQSGYLSTSQLNNNFASIQDALNNRALYRNNPVAEPNQMLNVLDMNSKRIINSPKPFYPTDVVRLQDLFLYTPSIGHFLGVWSPVADGPTPPATGVNGDTYVFSEAGPMTLLENAGDTPHTVSVKGGDQMIWSSNIEPEGWYYVDVSAGSRAIDITYDNATSGADGTNLQESTDELFLEKADLESPEFTGFPTAPTQPYGTINSTLATTEFVMTALANLGQVSPFAMTEIPLGWLVCDGLAISRTTYADLFATIGTVFGVGDGSTTFNVPDLRGKFLRGFDDGRGVDDGRVFGSDQASTIGPHTHGYYAMGGHNSTHTYADHVEGTGLEADRSGRQYTTDANTGLGTDTRPVNVAIVYCINATIEGGNGGPGGPGSVVSSVTAAPGVEVTGTSTAPIVGLDYEIVTEAPADASGTVDGHLWFVVDA